jgi:hypothetical protein
MGIAIGGKNRPDQASTRRSPGMAFQRSSGPAYQKAALTREGSNRDRLYFPVKSDGAIALAAANAPERDACISLLISGSRSLRRPPNRLRHDAPEHGGLYFPVNSRNNPSGAARMSALADRCRFRRMLRRPRPDRHCQSCRSLLTRTPRRSAHLPALPLFCCAK